MSPQRPAHRARHRREQSVPAAGRARPRRAAVRRAPAADRHALRSVHRRGLDALNYACYQDARFMLVATPSGITLAPEGGAHQSIITPLIGIGQPGLTAFEPAYRRRARGAAALGALAEIQREDGGSVYLRLSTRPLDQPERTLDPALAEAIVAGAYWLREPAPGGRAGDRLLRRGCRPRRSPRTRRSRGHAGGRPAGGHLARPAAPRLAGGAGDGGRSARPSGCWRGCAPAPRW